MFVAALCGLCLAEISSIVLESCGADTLGCRTVPLIKMDFHTETHGRIFLSTVRMLVVFYSSYNRLKKILRKALSNQEASRGFWRHLLPLTAAGTKIKASLGTSEPVNLSWSPEWWVENLASCLTWFVCHLGFNRCEGIKDFLSPSSRYFLTREARKMTKGGKNPKQTTNPKQTNKKTH